MSQNYYVRFRGRVLGPMPADKIAQLIHRGQVTRMHELSADGIQWQKSEAFTEFYPKAKQMIVAEEVAAVANTTSPSSEIKVAAATQVQHVAQWYAHVNEEHEGPVDEPTIRKWIGSGRITGDTLIWMNGMQEWEAANVLRPQWFSKTRASDSQASQSTSVAKSGDALAIVGELQKRRVWVYVLAITAIVLSSLYVVFMIFALVSQFVAPAESGASALVAILFSLFAFALSILSFLAFISLLQYANALSVLHYAPTQENLLRSLRKLSMFWFYAGICTFSALLTFGLLAVLTYAAGLRLAYLLGK